MIMTSNLSITHGSHLSLSFIFRHLTQQSSLYMKKVLFCIAYPTEPVEWYFNTIQSTGNCVFVINGMEFLSKMFGFGSYLVSILL